MKLPLTPSFSGLISNILSRAGGQLLYEQLEEAAKSAEERFDLAGILLVINNIYYIFN